MQTDFYYDATRTCVFVDGAVHERVSVQDADRVAREALATRGLDVVEVGRPFEAAISRRPDVFGAPKPPVAEGVTRS